MRRLKRVTVVLILLFITVLIGCNIWVVESTQDQIYSEITKLPEHRVALVLGTSHRTASGTSNPYFEKRIETAAELYETGKVDYFILSGDNSTLSYNEPIRMLNALIKKGVPETVITLDYAGLRTLDSIIRSDKIFGQRKLIIISQSFHCYRALFISNFYGMDAVAMGADEPDDSFKVRFREYFARPMAVIDLYILNTEPKFLGQKEELNK